MPVHEIYSAGHKIVAKQLNPEVRSGPPSVVLHGVTGSVDIWLPEMLPQFVASGPCYSLSLPGHYPAVLPQGFRREDMTAEMFLEVLQPALRELVGEQPLTLIGHSTGGFAALLLASQLGERVSRVISLAGFARGRWSGALGIAQWLTRHGKTGQGLFKLFYTLNKSNKTIQPFTWIVYFKNIRKFYRYPHFKKLTDAFYPTYKKLDLDAMVHYFSAMPEIDITPRLTHISAPTLVVTGAQDPIIPPAEARHIAEQIPNAQLAEIDQAGHIAFIEQPQAYQKVVREWLHDNAPQ